MKPLIHCTIHIYRCERRPDWETKTLHYLIVMNCQFMVIDMVLNPHKPGLPTRSNSAFLYDLSSRFFSQFLFKQLPHTGACTSCGLHYLFCSKQYKSSFVTLGEYSFIFHQPRGQKLYA